jgi:hypothetical protein
MNDLIRPALYSAYHHVLPVQQQEQGEGELFDIVGKFICICTYTGSPREIAVVVVMISIRPVFVSLRVHLRLSWTRDCLEPVCISYD